MSGQYLYISWANWLGARVAELLDAAVRSSYADHARCFYSGEIREGAEWFRLNEAALDSATAAVVLLTSDGLRSHWQAYELGRLRRRCSPCVLLLVDLPADALGSSAYAHLNCSTPTNEVLLSVVRAGKDADGIGEDELGYLTEQEAVQDFGSKLRHLLDAFAHLQRYKAVNGRSEADRIARFMHLQKVVHGFCSAGLSIQKISDKLRAEHVPGAAYIDFFQASPCNTSPRVDWPRSVG
jgi:hypothetical protein